METKKTTKSIKSSRIEVASFAIGIFSYLDFRKIEPGLIIIRKKGVKSFSPIY